MDQWAFYYRNPHSQEVLIAAETQHEACEKFHKAFPKARRIRVIRVLSPRTLNVTRTWETLVQAAVQKGY